MSIYKQLTKRQKAIFMFIRDKIEGRGYGPTVREIAEKFDIASPNGVMCHLRALEKKGLITREPNMSRAIKISSEVTKAEAGLPVNGQVEGGVFHEADEENERVDFGAMFAKKSQFVLRVAGNSMTNANINDGDYIILTKAKTAKAGQIALVQTEDGESSLKYWHPEKSRKRVRLQPINSKAKATHAKNPKVLGVLTGVVRKVV